MIEIIYTLIVTHITIVCVTLYLHRGLTHRAIIFHPLLSHFMRFWLWITTGMVSKEWVAVHRKHHRFSDEINDPHSPVILGIHNVLFKGWKLYHQAAADRDMVKAYGTGTPDDWLERYIYTPQHVFGILLMLAINVLLFGLTGVIIWIVQMLWIPFWAAGVINGVGHWVGYRNGNTSGKDHSRNISPVGIVIGGEELHNNHHMDPGNIKLSRRWFEFDIGYGWFKIFEFCKLAKLRQDE